MFFTNRLSDFLSRDPLAVCKSKFKSYESIRLLRGDVKIPHSRMTKNMYATSLKRAFVYHLLGVLDYYVMYGQRTKSVL